MWRLTALVVVTISEPSSAVDHEELFKAEYHNVNNVARRLNPRENAIVQQYCQESSHYDVRFPWSAILTRSNGSRFCAATFISFRHLVVAGKCFRDLEGPEYASERVELFSGLGCAFSQNISTCAGQRFVPLLFEMAFFVLNASSEAEGDISLVQLEADVDPESSEIRPLCLPKPNDDRMPENAFTIALKAHVDPGEYTPLVQTPLKLKEKPTRPNNAIIEELMGANDGNNTEEFSYFSYETEDGTNSTILLGTGVYLRQANETLLYGYVAEIDQENGEVAVQKVQRFAFDFCFYTGACATKDLEESRADDSSLNLYLDMAYVAKYHHGKPPTFTPPVKHFLSQWTNLTAPFESLDGGAESTTKSAES